MNIVFLMQDTGLVYGAERATLDLAEGLLAGGGCGVHTLLIRERRLNSGRRQLESEIRCRNLPTSVLTVERPFSPALIRGIRDALGELEADVLHTVGYKSNVHGGLAVAWGRSLPCVATVHGWLYRPDLKERFYEWVDLMAMRRFTRVVALSRHYERELLRGGISRDRLVRIPTGLLPRNLVPVDRATAVLESREKVLTLGMLGRLSHEKNHDMLIGAARILKERGVTCRWVIAGEGPDKDRIRGLVAQAGVGDIVEMPGYIDTPDFFSRAHVLVSCSRIENLPYSILEAMNWCRPVVATQVGGVPDLVDDGVTGRLLPPGDAGALADRVSELVRDREPVAAMGLAGRARLEREFMIDRVVADHRKLYETACSSVG